MDSGRLFFSPPCNGDMFLGNGTRSVMNMEETSKRRTLFSSPDELFADEYYDQQSPGNKRRLSPEQVHLLEKTFETENKLEPDRKTQLANKLGLQPRQVAVWFQNRRARWKTKQLERDYDDLKSSYDSLVSDYDSILKHNEKLKAEVVSLTEKLQAKAVAGEPMPDPKPEPLAVEADHILPLQLTVKVEDRLSTGTGGSAVVDEDLPQLVDSGDSYFPNNDYQGCVGPMDHGGVHSEEDDGSDGGRGYLSHVSVAAADHQRHQEEREPVGWWPVPLPVLILVTVPVPVTHF